MTGKRYQTSVVFRGSLHRVEMHVGQDLGGWTVGFDSPTTGTFKKSRLKTVKRYKTPDEAEAVLVELAEKNRWTEVSA